MESRQQKQNRITAFVLTYNLIHAKNYVLTYVYEELVKTYINKYVTIHGKRGFGSILANMRL